MPLTVERAPQDAKLSRSATAATASVSAVRRPLRPATDSTSPPRRIRRQEDDRNVTKVGIDSCATTTDDGYFGNGIYTPLDALATHSIESLRMEAPRSARAAPDAAVDVSQTKLDDLLPNALEAYRATLRHQLNRAQALEQETTVSYDAQQKVLLDLSAARKKTELHTHEV